MRNPPTSLADISRQYLKSVLPKTPHRRWFRNYNGNNRKEIIRLRKLWKPKCSKCGSVMELLLTTEVEDIGHTPSSIYKCVKCVNYYYIEISQDKRKWISWTYGTNPRIWKAKELNKIRENFYKKMFDFII